MLSDRDDQLVMGEYRVLPMLLVVPDTLQALREPVREGKIDCFVEIELPRWGSAEEVNVVM